MVSKRAVALLIAVSALITTTALAQVVSSEQRDPQSIAEFGRTSGGQIETLIKQPSQFSGSFGLSSSHSAASFLSGGNTKTFGANLGGTLLKDRLWFFATAERGDGLRFDPALTSMPTRGAATRGFGTMNAQLGDRQSLAASGDRAFGAGSSLPSSFLSLRYTGIVSSNMFFTANFSRQSSTQTQPGFLLVPTP